MLHLQHIYQKLDLLLVTPRLTELVGHGDRANPSRSPSEALTASERNKRDSRDGVQHRKQNPISLSPLELEEKPSKIC